MQHALDMRYAGQSYELTVPVVHGADFVTVFHALHGQRYGYAHPDEPVEVVAVRVTASGRTPKPSLRPATAGGPDASLARVGTRPVWFRREPGAAAEPVETPLYERERLRPAHHPRAGCHLPVRRDQRAAARLDRAGRWLPQSGDRGPRTNVTSAMIDPIALEIFRHLFASVAEEMGVTLGRTAYSPNIKERRDYSCALFLGDGRLLAQAAHIPVHLGAMPASVRAAVTHGAPFAPGDVMILNDPYMGGTHMPDVTLVSPVFRTSRRSPAAPCACRRTTRARVRPRACRRSSSPRARTTPTSAACRPARCPSGATCSRKG
jgi:hypothetical protein